MAPDDSLAQLALAHFVLRKGFPSLRALGGHGGFSGARLWRCGIHGATHRPPAWPQGVTQGRVRTVHFLMARARARPLDFVPHLFMTHTLQTWLSFGSRVWELATWLPGLADFHAHPTPGRLESACVELAHLHQAWPGNHPPSSPC